MQGLVESMIDAGTQTQMCGMELTLQKIERFCAPGAVSFDNWERVLPATDVVRRLVSSEISTSCGCFCSLLGVTDSTEPRMLLGR